MHGPSDGYLVDHTCDECNPIQRSTYHLALYEQYVEACRNRRAEYVGCIDRGVKRSIGAPIVDYNGARFIYLPGAGYVLD